MFKRVHVSVKRPNRGETKALPAGFNQSWLVHAFDITPSAGMDERCDMGCKKGVSAALHGGLSSRQAEALEGI